MTEKLYISAQQLLEDSWDLAARIVEGGFRPNFIVGIWRGGAPIGIAVQDLLAYIGIESDHIAIRTSSYSGIDQRYEHVRVHGLAYIVERVVHTDRLLIVDDVFDTGFTIEAVITELKRRARRNTPRDIRVAVPWYKPERNETSREPDYYVHTTEKWVKFPHSLEGLTIDELRENRPELFRVVERLLVADRE